MNTKGSIRYPNKYMYIDPLVKVCAVLLNKKTSDSFDHFPVINTTSSGSVQINPYHGFLIADPKEALLKYPNTPQKDKYFHISFSVSYLFYKVHCPSGRQFGPLKY